jgi:uncharacterized protein YndB with AHSA1/START domain
VGLLRPFEASTTIEASPDQVWAVLADSAGWSQWDSGVDGVDGVLAPGKRVTVRSSVAPGRAFPVTVTRFEPGECLELTGGFPLGLFRGVRTYRLRRDGSTTGVTMREEYSGPLSGLIGRSIPDLQPSFEQFVSGLKQRVERGR